MGTLSGLRRLLRSLCHGTPWKYAVFWRLRYRSRMLLTWEDGYCVPTKTRDEVEEMPQNGIRNGEAGVCSFIYEMEALTGSSTECPIELAVANMSCHMYSLGEGVIGNVAFTGKHQWIFSESVKSKIPSECPLEWLEQFEEGIQTILLIPVVPYGVLQLGSLEMVTEDLEMVGYIKDLFSTMQHTNSTSFTLDGNPFNPSSSQSSSGGRFLSFSAANADEWTQPQAQLSRKKDCVVPKVEQMTKNVRNVDSCGPSSSNEQDASLLQNNMQHMLGMDMGLCFDGNSWKAIYNAIASGVNQESCVLDHSLYSHPSGTMEDGIPGYASTSVLKEPSQHNIMQSAMVNSENEDQQAGSNYCFIKKTNDQAVKIEDLREMSSEVDDFCLNFPIDSELHKALGSTFLQENDTCLMDMWLSGETMIGSSFLNSKLEGNRIHDLAPAESSGWLLKQNGAEHLLDAVISGFYASDDSASNPSRGTSPSDSSGQFGGSCLTNIKHENDALAAGNSGPLNHEKPSLLTRCELLSTSLTGFQCQSKSSNTSMLMDEEQKMHNGNICEQFNRNMKSQCIGKRKAKSADVQRARPRDRQLIQDRIKELRELVPNGSKCSIDALLDRTIKHMLFLQSVSSQGKKLKHYAHSKVESEKRKPAEPVVHQKGATWAYDIGSQTEVCPIVVENLEQPGHMLVEMLCNEYGLFLEIAQVIKHLELTILKGVMETRSHKLWAHFIVEASRGFHRMDILWPLMQLLQRQSRPITNTLLNPPAHSSL